MRQRVGCGMNVVICTGLRIVSVGVAFSGDSVRCKYLCISSSNMPYQHCETHFSGFIIQTSLVISIEQTIFTFSITNLSKDLGEFRQCPHPIVLMMAYYCAPRSSDDRLSLTHAVISTSTAASMLADSYCLSQHFAHPSICRFTCMRRKSKHPRYWLEQDSSCVTAFLAIVPY